METLYQEKAADRASLPTTHPCFHLFFLLIILSAEVRDPKPQFFRDLVPEPGQGHAQLFGDMKFSEGCFLFNCALRTFDVELFLLLSCLSFIAPINADQSPSTGHASIRAKHQPETAGDQIHPMPS